MGSSFLGEHKTGIAVTAAGAGAGALLGRQVYSATPTKMVRFVQEGSKKTPYITDKFIKYAQDVSIKDLYSKVDPHTDRAYLNHKKEVIKKNASKAKIYKKGGERWQFQKIYDLGVKFMTRRGEVNKEDLGLAKRGANAIYHGRKVEMRNTIGVCALIGGLVALGAKYGIEKYMEYKNSKEDLKNPSK